MAKRGGYPGGGYPGGGRPNMGNMMKQAQKMQEQLAQAQEQYEQAQAEVKEMECEGTSGGGMVKVVVSGDMQVKSIEINPEAVDPDDVEMLEDLVLAAINEALRSMSEKSSSHLDSASSDLDMPDLSGIPGLGNLGNFGR